MTQARRVRAFLLYTALKASAFQEDNDMRKTICVSNAPPKR